MMHRAIIAEARRFLEPRFNRYLLVALLLLGALAFVFAPQAPAMEGANGNLTVQFFYSPTCPHCAAEEEFIKKLSADFPEIKIVSHDVTVPEEARLLQIMAQNRSIEITSVPATFIGNRIFLGFESESTTGAQIRSAVSGCLNGSCGNAPQPASGEAALKSVEIPLLGKTDLSSLSLPLLAIVLGLVDGFNPCAMWVLVYLISLVMGMSNRTKMVWLVVGTFVAASGILYFLFMTAWLNAFLVLGYVRVVNIAVGLIALGWGVLSVKEYMETKGALVCDKVDVHDRKHIISTAKELVSAPFTWVTVIGIVLLAFTVNSLEFVCSAAIPAAFTQVLALSNLSSVEHYLYIALYDLFFMLDDLIVFGLAAFTFSGVAGEKYAKYCKIIGGAVLVILGVMLLFAPRMLA